MYKHDTYDRRIQLGASRRRWEDAEALYDAGRWCGAIYLAGYAIECSLKAYICYYEGKTNLKDTKVYQRVGQGASLHSLNLLLQELKPLQRAIDNDITKKYKNAWNTITIFWQKDELRYWDKLGEKDRCERFMAAIRILHEFILRSQKA